MKTFIIILLLFIASCSVISYHFFYSGEIGKSNKELEKVVEKGLIIIEALEEFKKNSGKYPQELVSLYPEYINNDVNLVYEFLYFRGDHIKGKPLINKEIDSWGGYKLVLLGIKEWSIPLGRSHSVFLYYPSKLYPERKWEKPVKRVKDWALIIRYRSKGEENPIVGPGV